METDRLRKIMATEIMRPARKVYPRRHIVVGHSNATWSIDLADMHDVSDTNEGYRYILVVVDVFSRFAWCEPIKQKTGASVAEALEKIIKESGVHPGKIMVDQGKEFYNTDVTKVMKKYGISTRYSIFGVAKSAIAERFIRTLKTKLWQYFLTKNTRKWTDVLQDVVNKYNHKIHGTTHMVPDKLIHAMNQEGMYHKLYAQYDVSPAGKPKFKVGDHVRMSKVKGIFEKGYYPNWSAEVFTIAEVHKTNPFTYTLRDYFGEQIQGTFYEPELMKTLQKPDEAIIDKILKRKTVKGQRMAYVQYFGIEKPMWIPETNIEKS